MRKLTSQMVKEALQEYFQKLAPIPNPPEQSNIRKLPNGQDLTANNLANYLQANVIQGQIIKLEWPDLIILTTSAIVVNNGMTGTALSLPFYDPGSADLFAWWPETTIISIRNSSFWGGPGGTLNGLIVSNIYNDLSDSFISFSNITGSNTPNQSYCIGIFKRPGMIYDPAVPPPGTAGTAYVQLYQAATLLD